MSARTTQAPQRSAQRKPVQKRSPSLTTLLEEGHKRGSLRASEVERSIMASPPDAAEFSLFLDLTKTLGIQIRERKRPEPPPPTTIRALGVYIRDISRYPLLTAAEERALARQAREGSEKARERMVLSNLRLVVSMARRFAGRGLDLEDLIEDGNLGLITAVERFDPEKGFRFSTYAAWWIRQSIAKGIAEQSRTLKIPLHVMRSLYRYLEFERRLSLEWGRPPSPEEICKAAGYGPRRSQRVIALVRGIKSLDEGTVGDASQGLSLLERLPAKVDLEKVIFRQMENAHLERLITHLSGREALVLRIRYGFMDGRNRSLTQTGFFLGVSRERVRQIEKRALRRLREWIEQEERDAQAALAKLGDSG
ncbi:MAG: sigma-70 family RNA polymerase sigma factor [Candidatus Eisenbacteria bacterium]|nr:sigma-70 family RNA polymerase sigma factor [Candidatus Eisenbacteria bacterium]